MHIKKEHKQMSYIDLPFYIYILLQLDKDSPEIDHLVCNGENFFFPVNNGFWDSLFLFFYSVTFRELVDCISYAA